MARNTPRRCAVLAAFVTAVLACASARAQVVFDAASNSTATVSTANPVAVSWNHTVGAAKKPYLVVGVSMKLSGGGATVGAVTYGSEAGGPAMAMTFLGAATNGTTVRSELWGVANPTAGTHQITVSVTNGGAQNLVVVGGAKSFTNVLETAATGAVVTATGTSTTPSVNVTNTPLAAVVDAVSFNGNNALTVGANQTNAYDVTNAAPAFSGGGSIETGRTNSTMSWTAGASLPWAIAAVPLQPSSPQILFDDASSATGVGSNANPIVVTWSHTTTTAANRYLVVQVGIRLGGGTYGTNVTTTSVKYGTQTMTLLGGATRAGADRAELWGLVAPASGTNAITVTVANTGARNLAVTCGAQSFSGVDQAAPVGALAVANNNTTTPTVTVTNAANDYVVDAVAFNTNIALAAGARQDQRWNTITTPQNFSGGSSGARGYANVTMSWTQTGGAQNWAIAAIPLKQASVTLTKTASADVVKLGSTVTYTITATNYGSATATNVTITDAIPSGATFVSQTGCAGSGPVSCNIGSLAIGQTSAPITITVLPNAAGTITNVASVTFNGGTTPNNSDLVSVVAEAKVCASPGKDGAGGTLAGIKNDYWPGASTVAAGATSVTVGARNAAGAGNTINAGDLLIFMQMQDAAFDTTNDETYGDGSGSTRGTGTGSGASTALNNAGRWEYAIAANSVSAAGGTLQINGGGAGGGLLYAYTSQTFATTTTEGQRTWQVIRVPQYTTATLGSTLTALPWNGATGGVLAVDVSGTLSLGGATVSVNGLGFRGGGGRVLTGDVGLNTDFRTPATLNVNGSKGEGITGTPRYLYQSGATIGTPGSNTPLDTGVEGYVGGSYGRGAPGNAGGGSTDGDPAANGDNSGGGGGGNSGSGGAGGNGWNCNCPVGGQGGGGISPSLTRVTMGGGGGAGTSNNGSAADAAGNVLADGTAAANGYYSSGANGGGVVIIRALQATGTATITANGFNAANVGRDGGGGGGAGGSILLTTQIGDLSGLTAKAKGGNGGNAWLLQAPGGDPGERHGPGGGGGGGYILLSSAAASTDVSGGTNGLTTTANDDYGSQPGTSGFVELLAGANVLPGGDGASCVIADLAVTNSAPPTAIVTNNYAYTQSVTNNGPNTADGIVYMAPIPADTTYQSISVPPGWTCITPAVGGIGVVTCTTPTLASGATANFSLVVKVNGGILPGYVLSETNSVSSNTPDSNPANNSATATTIVENGQPDLAITITENTALPTAGSNISYTPTLKNIGDTAAANPTYTVSIPANTTFQSMSAPPPGWTCIIPAVGGTGTISCSSSTALAAGASALTFPFVVKVNAGTAAGTTITASPTVGTSSTEMSTANNTASITATVVAAGSADVAVTLANSPDPVSPAETYTYSYTAVNNGPSAAANVSLSLPLPAGTNFAQSMTPPAGWSCSTPAIGSGGTITCTIAPLAAGASASFKVVAAVNAGTASGTTLSATATISTTTPETITSNNTSTATNLVTGSGNAEVAIAKSVSPSPVGQGNVITYRLTVTNNGPATATNVTVSDPLDSSFTFVRANPSIGSCAGTSTISCALGTLPVGNSQFVDIVVQTSSAGTIPNTATISATQTDPVSSNNSSTANVTILTVTLVRLRDFAARQHGRDVAITWQTSFESDNLGFNVYRDVGGVRTKVNPTLIAGTALVAKKHDGVADHVYRVHDALPSDAFVQYWLEDVDTSGRRTMHGPVSPTPGDAAAIANATPLPGLGANGSVLASAAGEGVVRALDLPAATPARTKQQLDLASTAGLKIYVSQEGWQRVTRAAMIAAGYDPGPDARGVSLYDAGAEVPIVVNNAADGTLDSIEFYGLPLDTVSTGARTYWLRAGHGNAARVATSSASGGAPLTGDVAFTVEKKDRSIYFAGLINNGDATNFFGPLIAPWPVDQTLDAGALDTTFGGNAHLDLTIQGATDQMTHVVDVAINGHDAGTATLQNQDQVAFGFDFPQAWLVPGANTLTLRATNGDYDISVGVVTRLTVQHRLRADNGELEASLPAGVAATIGGFTTDHVRAIDVTDSENPIALATTVAPDADGGFAATFTPQGSGPRIVLAFDDARVITPSELTANAPSTWSDVKNKANADLLIISNHAFIPAASTLVPVRQRDGISSAVIDVEDLYDEFNFGVRSPEAIRAFLQSTTQWKTPPRWVLLAGDASSDPRDYLGVGAFDFVPTKLIPTSMLKTATDDWFTDFNGDGIADIAIGRIPVRTPDEAATVFAKITSRGTPAGAWAKTIVAISDGTTADFDFRAAAASAIALAPASMTKQLIDLGTTASPRNDIIGALNAGSLLTTYVGHGSIEIWGDMLFGSGDAAQLANGNRLPFVSDMECLNGYFQDVYTVSLAEALMKAQNGGAVAVWASSSLTEPVPQADMNRALFAQLFTTPSISIGEAVQRAKQATSDREVRETWILFGDPSMRLTP